MSKRMIKHRFRQAAFISVIDTTLTVKKEARVCGFLLNDCLNVSSLVKQLCAEKRKRDIDFHLHDERSTFPVRWPFIPTIPVKIMSKNKRRFDRSAVIVGLNVEGKNVYRYDNQELICRTAFRVLNSKLERDV